MIFKISVSRISKILLLLLVLLTSVSGLVTVHAKEFDLLITIIGAGLFIIIWIIVLSALLYNLFFELIPKL